RRVEEQVMAAIRYRFRAELRTRWRAWLALAVLIGIAGGAVIAMVAGATRTDSAYGRFLRDQRAFDAVARCPTGARARPCDLDALRALPQVEGAGPRSSSAVGARWSGPRAGASRSPMPTIRVTQDRGRCKSS